MTKSDLIKSLDLICVDIIGNTREEQIINIENQIDQILDARLLELQKKAVKGKPEDIVIYNTAFDRDKRERMEIKQIFINELYRCGELVNV